jgi:hypothetical protein
MLATWQWCAQTSPDSVVLASAAVGRNRVNARPALSASASAGQFGGAHLPHIKRLIFAAGPAAGRFIAPRLAEA